MSDRSAFLEAILESPHDDSPSLIFADWLEEQGDLNRAELIRTQTELSSIEPGNPDRVRLEANEHLLLDDHYANWRSERSDLPELSWGKRFEQGLIRSATLYAGDRDNVEHSLAHLHTHWPVRRLWLLRLGLDAARILGQSPQMGRITELWISCEYNENVHTLLHSPKLTNLVSLNCVVPRMVKSLAHWLDSLPLPKLKRLKLIWPGNTPVSAVRRGTTWTGTRLATSLIESRKLRELERLDLSMAPLGPLGVKRLADAPSTANLRVLRLKQTECGDKGAKALADSPYLAGLTDLALSGNQLTDAGAAFIANSRRLSKLSTLDLSHNHLGDSGLSQLAQSEHLSSLAKLNVFENPIPFQDHKRYQGKAGGVLRSLDLGGNGFPIEGLALFAEWPVLANLRTLRLNHAQIGDEGAAYLANLPLLHHLERLELAHCGIRDMGGLALAASSSSLASLLWLDVSSAHAPRNLKPSTKSALRSRFANGVVLFSSSTHTASDDAR